MSDRQLSSPGSGIPPDEGAEQDTDPTRKIAATCTDCGAVYAAEVWPSGKIRAIGRREGCRCGATTFEVLEAGSDHPEK